MNFLMVQHADIFRRRAPIIASLAAIICIVITFYPFQRGPAEYLWKHLTNALHFPGFFGFNTAALLYVRYVLRKKPEPLRWGLRFVVLAALVELIQPFTGRDGSISDFVHGALGAICASIVFYFVAKKRVIFAMAGSTFAVALCFAIAKPLFDAYQIFQYEAEKFPKLFEACEPRDRVAWETIPRWPKEEKKDFVCGFTPPMARDRYWGLRYMAADRDWSEFESLVLTIAAHRSIRLRVRVDDVEDCRDFDDRYNGEFELYEGEQLIRIPLSDIASGPKSRKLNLKRIAFLYLFSGNAAAANINDGENTLDSNKDSNELDRVPSDGGAWTLIEANLE